jgi:hypothetical protein
MVGVQVKSQVLAVESFSHTTTYLWKTENLLERYRTSHLPVDLLPLDTLCIACRFLPSHVVGGDVPSSTVIHPSNQEYCPFPDSGRVVGRLSSIMCCCDEPTCSFIPPTDD